MSNSPPKSNRKSDDKVVLIVWTCILGIILLTLPFTYPKYRNWKDGQAKHSAEIQRVIDSCKGSEEVGDEILSFDTYYDNGSQEIPVCRLPATDEEKASMYRSRNYQRGLDEGTIDPEEGDAERCTGNVCY